METIEIGTRLGRVQGFVDGPVQVFRGLRYAEPPTGERRFLPPVASGPWDGTYDATWQPNQAMQLDMRLEGPLGDIMNVPEGAIDEDCLFLSVYTPRADDGRRPVMVWIHGGSHTSGSANVYDGSVLAAQGDVVVVCINYRLGAFGFLDLSPFGDEFAGSASNGFRDQILALEWVRDNIADYGGDPGTVTIFGESAGAISVMGLLGAPAADGLFHKAIAHSGFPFTTPNGRYDEVLQGMLGVTGDDFVAKLRSLSAKELLELQTMSGFGAGTLVGIDGVVITRSPLDAVAGRDIPVITGWNKDEGTLFTAAMGGQEALMDAAKELLARKALDEQDPTSYLAGLTTDFPTATDQFERVWHDLFHWGAVRMAQAADAWVYRFDLPSTAVGGVLGATHAADIAFTFNDFEKPGSVPNLYDVDDEVARELARQWSDTILAFARTGDPNGAGLPDWPRFGSDRRVLVLDNKVRVEADSETRHPADT